MLLFLLVFAFSVSRGQVLDTVRLDTLPIFTSLEKALVNPAAVYRLSLQKLKLKEVPAEIFTLSNLNELDLSKNKLTSIPPDIGKLGNLQVLKLSRNKLEKFPEEICPLENLLKLSIDQNRIDSISPCIGGLNRLVTIDAWNNDLSYFPDEMRKLKQLRWLDLRGILMSERELEHIEDLLRNAKVYADEPCNCDF